MTCLNAAAKYFRQLNDTATAFNIQKYENHQYLPGLTCQNNPIKKINAGYDGIDELHESSCQESDE